LRKKNDDEEKIEISSKKFLKRELERERERGGKEKGERKSLSDVGEIYIPHETGTINF